MNFFLNFVTMWSYFLRVVFCTFSSCRSFGEQSSLGSETILDMMWGLKRTYLLCKKTFLISVEKQNKTLNSKLHTEIDRWGQNYISESWSKISFNNLYIIFFISCVLLRKVVLIYIFACNNIFKLYILFRVYGVHYFCHFLKYIWLPIIWLHLFSLHI